VRLFQDLCLCGEAGIKAFSCFAPYLVWTQGLADITPSLHEGLYLSGLWTTAVRWELCSLKVGSSYLAKKVLPPAKTGWDW
jgi:hypothetical protein